MNDVTRKQLIAANWKMNLTYSGGVELVRKLASILPAGMYDRVDIAVLPPFTHIRAVQAILSADEHRLAYGAQDLSPHDGGAHQQPPAGGTPPRSEAVIRPLRRDPLGGVIHEYVHCRVR